MGKRSQEGSHMGGLTLAFPGRVDRRVCALTIGAILLSLLLQMAPAMLRAAPSVSLSRPGPAPRSRPVMPASPVPQPLAASRLPPGSAAVVNTTLAADDAADYRAMPLGAHDAGLRAANPAQ